MYKGSARIVFNQDVSVGEWRARRRQNAKTTDLELSPKFSEVKFGKFRTKHRLMQIYETFQAFYPQGTYLEITLQSKA